jgi:limonene-1,2-epoxide hydrolase
MTDNVQIIKDFIAAWSNLDAEELTGYFTEDGTYYNMPAEPVQGQDNLKKFIGGFIASWTKTTWDTLNIVGAGDVVFAERLDRTEVGEIKSRLGYAVGYLDQGAFALGNLIKILSLRLNTHPLQREP